MTRRTALAPIAALLTAAVLFAGQASAGPARADVPRNCGTLAAAGKTWMIAAAGVPCAVAKALVRTFAPKASGAAMGVDRGTSRGLSCIILSRQGKAVIECIGAQGRKTVVASAP